MTQVMEKLNGLMTREAIAAAVHEAVDAQPIIDLHTHLYPPSFGTPVPNATGQTDAAGLDLWGIDELLTYHYLVAEVFRVVPASKLSYEDFWKMSKTEQADHIWKHLFIERSPISEGCRGVLTCLQMLGLDPSERDLNSYRQWYREQDPSGFIDTVMQAANVKQITMTNAVFDDNERQRWLDNPNVADDSRFAGVLRFDPILRNWPEAAKKLSDWGYDCNGGLDAGSVEEAKRFVHEWCDRVKAIYCAVSLPPSFRYPVVSDDPVEKLGQRVLEEIVLPVCRERNIPFAMMIGSELQVNPALKDAGDMCGKSDVQSVVHLCQKFPDNRFFVTMLARENQHELCVAARKFGNLMIFGCWWFTNNPSIIEEMTRMRTELLGLSYIPQHSDARVLDQLTYKWQHSRAVISKVLIDKYTDAAATGWAVTSDEIKRDVRYLLHDNFVNHCG